jgi:hypothetical protein
MQKYQKHMHYSLFGQIEHLSFSKSLRTVFETFKEANYIFDL